MTDQEFLQQFETCTLPKEYFKHRDHLKICWLYVTSFPLEEALVKVTEGIKRYATHLGAQHIYHQTLTQAWVHILFNCTLQRSYASFDSFIENNPQLFQKNLMLQFYSEERLNSLEAKTQWLEPDKKSFF